MEIYLTRQTNKPRSNLRVATEFNKNSPSISHYVLSSLCYPSRRPRDSIDFGGTLFPDKSVLWPTREKCRATRLKWRQFKRDCVSVFWSLLVSCPIAWRLTMEMAVLIVRREDLNVNPLANSPLTAIALRFDPSYQYGNILTMGKQPSKIAVGCEFAVSS